jgi:hypothetical protein
MQLGSWFPPWSDGAPDAESVPKLGTTNPQWLSTYRQIRQNGELDIMKSHDMNRAALIDQRKNLERPLILLQVSTNL